MKFSNFLVEGLYDKFFDIPNQITRIWNGTKRKGLKYKLIQSYLEELISSNFSMSTKVWIGTPDDPNDRAGGFYSPTSNYIAIKVSNEETKTDLDKIISTFMHEIVHLIQHKSNDTAFKNYRAVGSRGDEEGNARYFFQSIENSAMVYGMIGNIAHHDLSVSDVKSLVNSFSGDNFKEIKISALKKATSLQLMRDGEQYKMWLYYINTLAYGLTNKTYKSIASKFLDKLFKEYANFSYLKSK